MSRTPGWLVFLLVALIAVTCAYYSRPIQQRHLIIIRGNLDRFEFFVDQTRDGRYRYTAKLINLPFPISDQEETGDVPLADWKKLESFQLVTASPVNWTDINDPGERWGTFTRGNTSLPLRYVDWYELQALVVGEAYSRLSMAAKKSL